MIIETDDERMRYKLLRTQKGIKLSTSGIAQYVGVQYPMISMHENRKSNLDPDKETKYKKFIDNYVTSK